MSEPPTHQEEGIRQFRIHRIINETRDAKTFVLEPIDGRTVRYLPGQYLTFLIDHYGHEVRRSYSMSSAPSVDRLPAVTIKRVENGEMSRFWTNEVKEGDLVTALAPAGRFTSTPPVVQQPYDVVLIGAGSGITPLFSLLKELLVTDEQAYVTLIYANRSEATTIFFQQLTEWETRFPDRLRVIHLFSQPSENWSGLPQRLNNSRLEMLVPKVILFGPQRASFFLCGPYALMRTTEITIRFLGFEKSQIRKENFVIPPPPPATKSSDPHTATVLFHQKTIVVPVPSNTTLLQAALDAGIPLPYSCKGGQCANCAGLLRAGKLHMNINDVLTDADLKQGWVLTCTAYPEDDEVIVEIV
jgi:ring-1,2-phenylacetyl-CoA epoxidase subunit PaaE